MAHKLRYLAEVLVITLHFIWPEMIIEAICLMASTPCDMMSQTIPAFPPNIRSLDLLHSGEPQNEARGKLLWQVLTINGKILLLNCLDNTIQTTCSSYPCLYTQHNQNLDMTPCSWAKYVRENVTTSGGEPRKGYTTLPRCPGTLILIPPHMPNTSQQQESLFWS